MANVRLGQIRFGARRYAELGPDTQAEYLNQPYWKRANGTTSVSLPETVGGAESTLDLGPDTSSIFTLEIRDGDGALVGEITDWFSGSLRLEVDRASVLRFTIAADDALADDLEPPNLVWCRDRWGLVIETFRVSRTTQRREGESLLLEYEGVSRIAQLGREPVISYSAADTTVEDHVIALLDMQVQSGVITLGTIDPVIAAETMTLELQDTSILGGLEEIQRRLPRALAGNYYVTGDGALDWAVQIGTTGETLEIGKRLVGVERLIDWEQLVTRLYLYGQGRDPRSRVKLTDPGADQANEYIEGSTVGTYGVVPMLKIDRRVKYPASLLAMGQRILEETAEPGIELRVNVLDLAKADTDLGETFNDVYIGSEYTVTDANLGISTAVLVRAIEYDLSNPLPIRVELDNRKRDFADLWESLYSQIGDPLDVNDDGSRYPNIARLYDGTETYPDLEYRDGDLKHDGTGLQVRTDGAWEDIGTGGDAPDPSSATPEPLSDTGAAGTSTDYARADHVHAGLTADIPQNVGSVAGVGTSDEAARADHVHSGIAWGDEVGTLPSLSGNAPTIVYYKSASGGSGDDQLWIGYNGSGSTDQWTPMQKTTNKSGGTPT